MEVSIIIVNFNTLELTNKCINSILEHTIDIHFEIILVDNASTDGSSEFFSKDQRITFIANSENYGFGKANNIGAKLASGRNLFFLNSDTLLINNAIKILSDLIDSDSNIGVCGGNLYFENMKPAHSFTRIFPGLLYETNIMLLNCINLICFGRNWQFNYTNHQLDVAYITGADMMISKQIFTQMKGFDEDFFMYAEESELTYRIKKQGYCVISEPKAKIIHYKGKSFKHCDVRSRFLVISWKKFIHKKYHSNVMIMLCQLINYIANINLYLIYGILRKKEKQKTYRYFIFNSHRLHRNSQYSCPK